MRDASLYPEMSAVCPDCSQDVRIHSGLNVFESLDVHRLTCSSPHPARRTPDPTVACPLCDAHLPVAAGLDAMDVTWLHEAECPLAFDFAV